MGTMKWVKENIEDTNQTPFERMVLIDDVVRLRNLIRELPERDQRIIQLRFFDDMTLDQISVEMGRSRERIRQIIAEIISNLRGYMEADIDRKYIPLSREEYKTIKEYFELTGIHVNMSDIFEVIKFLPRFDGIEIRSKEYFDKLLSKIVEYSCIRKTKDVDHPKPQKARRTEIKKPKPVDPKALQAAREAARARRLQKEHERNKCYKQMLLYLMFQCITCSRHLKNGDMQKHKEFKSCCGFIQDFYRMPKKRAIKKFDVQNIVLEFQIGEYLKRNGIEIE